MDRKENSSEFMKFRVAAKIQKSIFSRKISNANKFSVNFKSIFCWPDSADMKETDEQWNPIDGEC